MHTSTNLASVRSSTLSHWMKVALQKGKQGVQRGERPFGAAIYRLTGEEVAVTCNTVFSTNNPAAHAEVNAITQACQSLGKTKLSDCWLLATAEPCPMCLSTAALAGIRFIAFGATQAVVKEAGYGDLGLTGREFAKQLTTDLILQGPVLGNECVSFLLNNRKRDQLG
ncbi:nucleoside deaminase [Rubripirellula reticaptiva]|uniref:Guanine deaminase n=1 Tax=Rubripirellula reticaptiva TaxID=2528013 RepID=A0A5C6FA57_9BACT|nr:nucleoside deaminase [Rubripirellula reticaptiva]TWU58268.1 Guanine deaminase [Rubripirellula reticaptiva]